MYYQEITIAKLKKILKNFPIHTKINIGVFITEFKMFYILFFIERKYKHYE